MPTQHHLSFYCFRSTGELPALRKALYAFCRERQLLGTILLAEEGVNGMLSGESRCIAELRSEIENRFGPGVTFHETESDPSQKFSRLLVKVKKELVPVGDPALSPERCTAARLSPRELKALLDRNAANVVLLDARNTYEVEVGSFQGAEHLALDCSRDFAARVKENQERWKGKTIVTFCTGGIRCEKGSAYLLAQGHPDVYQLDGGILRYFAELGSQNGVPHFRGHCFVFDWRMAVDGALHPVARSSDPTVSFGRHKFSTPNTLADKP